MPAKNGNKVTRVPWTKAHIRDLKAHSKSKTSVAGIAKALKRSVGAVRNKAHQLGIGVGHER